jgi:hypothetical protein
LPYLVPVRGDSGVLETKRRDTKMEGAIFDFVLVSPALSVICGLAMLAIAASLVLLGYWSDEERRGRRLFWAEWPVPGTEVPEIESVEEHPRREAA